MASAFLSRSALIPIVISAIEVYKKEAFGVLIGRRERGHYHVRYAISFQTAKRHYDYTSIDSAREKRINRSLSHMMNHRVIGDFHSHADGPAKLSKADVKDMKETGPGKVYILAVVKRGRAKKWRHNKDRSLSGPVGKYGVRLLAYEIRGSRLEKLKLRCNYTKGLNVLAKNHLKRRQIA